MILTILLVQIEDRNLPSISRHYVVKYHEYYHYQILFVLLLLSDTIGSTIHISTIIKYHWYYDYYKQTAGRIEFDVGRR